MKKRFITILIFATALILSACFTVYSFMQELNREKLPVIGQVTPFALTDETGTPFSLKNLQERVWVANFFFTTCGDICPVMSKNIKRVSEKISAAPGLRFVSISVNPEYDDPDKLSDYASKYDAGANWHFLTGAREQIKDLALNSFRMGKIDEPIFHSSYLTLVDRHGYIRGYYDGTDDAAMDKLSEDIRDLLRAR